MGRWPPTRHSIAPSSVPLTLTRPELQYAVQQVCLHMHAPRDAHWATVKRILRYVCGTMGYGLSLHASPSTSTDLIAYSDADWAGCPDTRRSTSGYCVYLSSSLVSWSSKRQPIVSRSSAEAEYRAVANVVAECTWLRQLLSELSCPIDKATLVFCDNVSAVYLSANSVHHRRTKHIELDIHFVREQVALGRVRPTLLVLCNLQYSSTLMFAFALSSSHLPLALGSCSFLLWRCATTHMVSHYGAMMVIFPSQVVCDSTIALCPLVFNDRAICLERPGLEENQVGRRYSTVSQLSAFHPNGSVCCINPLCINEQDYYDARVVLHLEDDGDVPHSLLVRDFEGKITTQVSIVVHSWSSNHGTFSHIGHFVGGGGDTPRRGGVGAGSGKGGPIYNIDEGSMGTPSDDDGMPSPPSWPMGVPMQAAQGPLKPMSLLPMIPDRRATALSPSAGLGSSNDPASSETPTMFSDRILSHMLALKFPGSGLSTDQVQKPLIILSLSLILIDATVSSLAPIAASPDPIEHADAMVLADTGEEHENITRKHRMRRKLASDSAFKARRSSRLAVKEIAIPLFTDMLTRAKATKVSRFSATKHQELPAPPCRYRQGSITSRSEGAWCALRGRHGPAGCRSATQDTME
ncbi:hypothetical protein QYE76_047492 [Lolium multiflorum]|uniref:Uncharacterized protein n=1 Tax=Lolium multiflorum TaxID=4521 RepID=A0AAD8X090_LOLMU|nr:hypothetical protein QYE76_047492 [Lolium multiflorum]